MRFPFTWLETQLLKEVTNWTRLTDSSTRQRTVRAMLSNVSSLRQVEWRWFDQNRQGNDKLMNLTTV